METVVQLEAMKLAEIYTEAVKLLGEKKYIPWTEAIEEVLKKCQAIEQAQKQEPVPSIVKMLGHCPECGAKAHNFASPPQRQWVGLTDSDKDVSHFAYSGMSMDYMDGYEAGMEAAEAKLKEKNT